MGYQIHSAPPNSGEIFLGRTLPSLLDEACEKYSNAQAFNQLTDSGWVSFSNQTIRLQSEEIAIGLQKLGLQKGDRVAFFMQNDAYFCLADMGCLIAGIIDVPIYLTYGPEITSYVMEHSESKALFVSDMELFKETAPLLEKLPAVQNIIIAEVDDDKLEVAKSMLPDGCQVMSLHELRNQGRARIGEEEGIVAATRSKIDPQDTASIIYTSGTTGPPKGVVLSHENISSNVLSCFSGLRTILKHGAEEVIVTFLPLTHILARTVYYGHLNDGHTLYFSTPDLLGEHLKEVRPTMFVTVPRLLEKVYNKILDKGRQLTGLKKGIFFWALELAKRYRLGFLPEGFYATQLRVADKLVFSKWREALGGRVKFVVSGGAALRPELTNIFSAAGVLIQEGYGLTETSPVIAFNRPGYNRAGSVGVPVPGVDVAIAEDGEILARGALVMREYYKNPEATQEVIDKEGWFHTGDIGEMTDEGYLVIKDRKKDLFKLSTGKYVMPQPLEMELMKDPLIDQAVVIGNAQRFCGALIFPNLESLQHYAAFKEIGANKSTKALLEEKIVLQHFEKRIAQANEHMPPWSQIKQFKLVPDSLTQENGVLTPSMKVRRAKVRELFAKEIEEIYAE